MSQITKDNVVIPLTHHKNSGYTELKVLGVYFSPPQAGERYTTLNYPFVHRIFSWCAKGIVIKTIIEQIIDKGILYNGDDIIESADQNEQEKTIEISSSDTTIEFKRYNPISYEFLDETYNIGKPNYTALLDSIVKVLYELDASVFEHIANSKLSPMQSQRIFVSTEEKDVRDALSPAPGIYVESNLASDYIIKFIYILIDRFGFSESDLKIHLKDKN